VNQAVTQMDQVTQANAAQTEELSSTAQSLAAQAEELQVLVGRFKLASDGPAARKPAEVSAEPMRVARPTRLERRRTDVKRGATRKTDDAVLAGASSGDGRRPAGGLEDF
jgi:methyl-accepting chemotaxis protein